MCPWHRAHLFSCFLKCSGSQYVPKTQLHSLTQAVAIRGNDVNVRGTPRHPRMSHDCATASGAYKSRWPKGRPTQLQRRAVRCRCTAPARVFRPPVANTCSSESSRRFVCVLRSRFMYSVARKHCTSSFLTLTGLSCCPLETGCGDAVDLCSTMLFSRHASDTPNQPTTELRTCKFSVTIGIVAAEPHP